MVSLSITGYMALLIVPEPISKGVAAVATVLLWGYLGWELWDLIRAYIRLSEESAQATRFEQLCLWPGSPTKVRGHSMRKSQLKTFPTERLVEEFRRLSAEHGHALEAARPRVANRRFDTLVAIRRELRSRGPEAQRQLLKLLADPEPSTRSWTARSVLEFAPSEAEQVLEELSRTQRNAIGVSAHFTLEKWREGTFKPL